MRSAGRSAGKHILGINTFREIKQSFGRFFAIMAIVALGVGLFAGLKVSRVAMMLTVEGYFEKTWFYDYRIVSTLGFGREALELFGQQEHVRAAEGALAFDILYEDGAGNEKVLKAHSLTENVNQVRLLAGRMPQRGTECVVDANLFDASAIGSVVRLAEGNAEEDLEHFAYREYEITGVVKSPLYIQFERGNTSLGVGSVSGFLYLPPEGFADDYFTEIYIKLDEDYPLYSDAYEEYREGMEGTWESLAAQAAGRRYEQLLADGEEELADAELTFAEEKAKGEAELADAKRELDEAAEKLADGERQLAEARRELADGRKTLEEKSGELADARVTLEEKAAELARGEEELADGIRQAEAGDRELAAGEEELKKGLSALERQEAYLAAQEETLRQGEAALEEAEAYLQDQQQLLDRQSAALDQLEAAYPEGAIPPETAAQIAAGRAELEAGYAELSAGLQETAAQRRELEAGKAALTAGREQLAVYRAQLHEGMAELAVGSTELSRAWEEIRKAKAEIEEGKKALSDAKEELSDGERRLGDARQELSDGETALLEKEAEFNDAQIQYQDGLREYREGLEEFDREIEEAKEELADARTKLDELKAPDSYVLGRDTNVGYVCFENDVAIVDGIANIFPVFFFLVAALICMTTMSRMVEEQRTQIGVFKALGYGEGAIMSKFLVYSGTAAVSGGLIGFFGGTWLFPWVIWECYKMMYRVEEIVYVFDWKLAFISLAVSALCSMGVTYLSCRRELNLVAAELMRPKAPKAGKRVFLERIPVLWRRLSFLRKVSFRNIFRYKKRLFMMVTGISGCTALLLTGFGLKDSIMYVADRQYGEIQLYDISAVFSEDLNERLFLEMEERAGAGLENYLRVMETAVDAVSDAGMKGVYLVVADPKEDLSPFLGLSTLEGEECAFPGKGEAVITHKAAEDLGLQTGDTLLLQNGEMETMTVRISGISRNYISNYIYIGADTYEAGMGRGPEYRTVYINAAQDADVHRLSAALMGMEEMASVTVNLDGMARISNMMQSMNLIVAVVIFCAAGLAFIVLYNLTNINITERIREIATIQVLGFYRRETAAYVFRENTLLTLMGMAVGLFLGRGLHLFVMNAIDIDMIAFDVNISFISYLYSGALTMIFAWCVNRFMGIKLNRISMTESLKSVD